MINVTFQALKPKEAFTRWEQVPIVYVLKNVPANKDISELCHAISTIHGSHTIRTARLFLNEKLTPIVACKYNGGYYTAEPKNY